MKICVFRYEHSRSKRIADALVEGARKMGWQIEETAERHTEPRADLFASYGWRNEEMFEVYRAAGCHFIYVDLGYWARKKFRSDYGGHHKVVVDAQHATRYFRRGRPHDRLDEAPKVEPWKHGGRHIILAGLSAKSAADAGLVPLEWENATIKALRRVTARPIVYRPKPSWHDAKPIAGCAFSPGTQPLADILNGAHAVVTRHSNAGIDALAAGVPVYSEEGLASTMSMASLADIEQPYRPADREQFIADVSYCHFTRHEIADGTVFRLLKGDGLI